MRIGFVSVYSFRPHVEQMYYLARLMRDAGHETFALTCDADVEACYGALLRDRSRLGECPRCILGGVRSFDFGPTDSVGRLAGPPSLSEARALELALSSSATLTRTEAPADLEAEPARAIRARLAPGIRRMHAAARRWITERRLDAVFGFNGRMDHTAAVWEATREMGVRYISVERTWFGHGIQLLPDENCLGTHAAHRLAREYRDRPLTGTQAWQAAGHIARRFLRTNLAEWRVYNSQAARAAWPGRGQGRRVLVLPSSRNEFEGHPDWVSAWPGGPVEALDQFLDRFGIDPADCVVRAHPNWSERIGVVSGEASRRHYAAWAERRGAVFVPPESRADTYDLLAQADVAVLNGGSTALEAAALGKRVVLLGTAKYAEAGFAQVFGDPAALAAGDDLGAGFDAEQACARMLRFMYLQMARIPQFTAQVRALDPTRYEYLTGGDPGRLERLVRSGELEVDDARWASDDSEEREVVAAVLRGDWPTLAARPEPRPSGARDLHIARRRGLRWLDGVRARLARGDR